MVDQLFGGSTSIAFAVSAGPFEFRDQYVSAYCFSNRLGKCRIGIGPACVCIKGAMDQRQNDRSSLLYGFHDDFVLSKQRRNILRLQTPKPLTPDILADSKRLSL